VGLLKLTQICHRVLPLLFSIWDRSSEPGRGDDKVLEGNTDVKERKGEGGLYSRNVQGLRRIG